MLGVCIQPDNGVVKYMVPVVYNGLVKYMVLGVYNGMVKYMVLDHILDHAIVMLGAYPYHNLLDHAIVYP
jgi:hypothetical protein